MPVPDINELNRKISDAGANWTAVETPYSRLTGEAVSMESMGLALTPEAALADLLTARIDEANILFGAAPPALPRSVDWRNHNGQNWVTQIRDQSTCGACVAFATIATVESRVLIQENRPGVNFDLSEAHLFFCGAGNACQLGWQPAPALAYAQAHGLGREASFPYTPGNQQCRQVPTVVNCGSVSTAAMMIARKQAIVAGPVVAAFAVYDDFFNYGSGIYRHVWGNLAGYHAVCVVGYDDSGGCWIAKNSWGPNWGASGFFEILYGECGIDSQFPFYYPDSVTLVPGTTIP